MLASLTNLTVLVLSGMEYYKVGGGAASADVSDKIVTGDFPVTNCGGSHFAGHYSECNTIGHPTDRLVLVDNAARFIACRRHWISIFRRWIGTHVSAAVS